MATAGFGRAKYGLCGIASIIDMTIWPTSMALYKSLNFGAATSTKSDTYQEFFFGAAVVPNDSGTTRGRRIRTWHRNQS